MALSPATIGVVVALYALLWIMWHGPALAWSRLYRTPFAVLVALVAGLGVLSASWSIVPLLSYHQALKFALVMWPLAIWSGALRTIALSQRATCALLLGFMLSVVLLAIQVFGDFVFRAWLVGAMKVPAAIKLNVPVAAFSILIWIVPALLNARRWALGWRVSALGALALCAAAIIGGDGTAPKLALGVGIGVWLVAQRWPRLVLYGIGVAVLSFHVLSLTVPLAVYARPPLMTQIPDVSVRHRIDVWASVDQLIRIRPWLGYGLASSSKIPPSAELSTVTGQPRHIPLYPHNVLLQAQLELGVLGVIAFYCALGLALRGSFRATRAVQPAMFAMLSATLSIWCVGYPLWRSTWIVWLAYCAITISLVRGARRAIEHSH